MLFFLGLFWVTRLDINSMKFDAIIFDMDGLLIDSELPFRQCDIDFFARRGIIFDQKLEVNLKGNSMLNGTKWIKEYFGLSELLEDLLKERLDDTAEIYRSVANLMDGADEIVKAVKKLGYKTAIASGNMLDRINMIVDRFDWYDYFDVLASTDHVGFVGKPSPDVNLYAAKQLNVLPERCLVLEDSESGVVSAKAAGMACIAVRETVIDNLDSADLIVSTLLDKKIIDFITI